MKTDYAGIDYSGPNATCNRDKETGIRYGIIWQGDVMPEAIDDFEPEYGDPHCPECGAKPCNYSDLSDDEQEACTQHGHGCADWACQNCNISFDSDRAFPDEPIGHSYDRDGYSLSLDSSGDVWVSKSPYFTYAQFCSPCAPGACHLGNPLAAEKFTVTENDAAKGNNICPMSGRPLEPGEYMTHASHTGNKCYCMGHDWFDGGKAPYDVWSVETGDIVQPAS